MTKATESKAGKKKAGSQLVSMKDLEKMYAVEAKATLESEPLGGAPIISTRGKKFRIGEIVLKAPLNVVVLGTSFENKWFDQEYDPEMPGAPACCAVSEPDGKGNSKLPETMAPQATVPVRQHETCRGCPKGAFGSADKGRGKACGNYRRVAVIGITDDRPEPQIMMMRIPPTGLKKFSSYTTQAVSLSDRPLHGVITSFDFDETQDWPVPVATFVGVITDVSLAQKAKNARERAVKEMLYAPFDTSGYVAPGSKKSAPKVAKGGKAKKANGKKQKF